MGVSFHVILYNSGEHACLHHCNQVEYLAGKLVKVATKTYSM